MKAEICIAKNILDFKVSIQTKQHANNYQKITTISQPTTETLQLKEVTSIRAMKALNMITSRFFYRNDIALDKK
jgi:hypothetical protein